MSPSVLSSANNPILSSKIRDMRMKPEVKRIQRTLFGPIDRAETRKFLDDELKKIITTKSQKWNFDFEKERTLKPEGLFEWRPVTPRKQSTPLKRKLESEHDISDQYCELPCEDVVVSSTPVKSPSPTRIGEHKSQQQSRITDFMKATKRALSFDVSKKQPSEWNTDRPTKIPRLDIVS